MSEKSATDYCDNWESSSPTQDLILRVYGFLCLHIRIAKRNLVMFGKW